MPKLSTHDKLAKLKRITFTKEGFEKLERDLERLKSERPAAVKELARAREMGDLSENGLYTAAKARLNSLDNQIFRAEMTIKFAEVVDAGTSNSVQIGSKVAVLDGSQEIVYQIVGDTEANPKENKITTHSPIGVALMGKSVGDVATITLPSGERKLKIKEIF